MLSALGLICLSLTANITYAAEQDKLQKALAPLQFLVGWCWSGEFPDGKRVDTHCYESMYSGAHLRDRHVVTGGPSLYQGETIYSWNKAGNRVSYVYWNSYGGVSQGTMTQEQNAIRFPDESYTGTDGKSVTISTLWENITADGYDSVSIEESSDGTKKERRVRYQRKDFMENPANHGG